MGVLCCCAYYCFKFKRSYVRVCDHFEKGFTFLLFKVQSSIVVEARNPFASHNSHNLVSPTLSRSKTRDAVLTQPFSMSSRSVWITLKRKSPSGPIVSNKAWSQHKIRLIAAKKSTRVSARLSATHQYPVESTICHSSICVVPRGLPFCVSVLSSWLMVVSMECLSEEVSAIIVKSSFSKGVRNPKKKRHYCILYRHRFSFHIYFLRTLFI